VTSRAAADAPTGYRAVLAVPEMRAVLSAHLVSMVGTVVAQLSLSVLVFQRTGSPLLSALTLALSFLPQLLSGTLLSGVADRYPARRILVACDLLAAAVSGLLAVPGMPVAALLGLVAVTGLVRPVFSGTRAASLADLLPGPLFVLGRSWLRLIAQTSMVLGFAAGGLLLSVVTPRVLLLADAGSFLLSALLLRIGTRLRPARPRAAGESVLADAAAGLREVRAAGPLRRLLLLSWLVPGFSVAGEALATPYAASVGAGGHGAGALFAAAAAGTVLGELVAARLPVRLRVRLVLPTAALALAPLLGFLATPPLPVAAGLLALAGTGLAYGLGLDALLLAATPEAARGRVLTLQSAGLMVSQGLGFAAAGALGTVLAPGTAVAVAAAVGLVGLLSTARALLTSRDRLG